MSRDLWPLRHLIRVIRRHVYFTKYLFYQTVYFTKLYSTCFGTLPKMAGGHWMKLRRSRTKLPRSASSHFNWGQNFKLVKLNVVPIKTCARRERCQWEKYWVNYGKIPKITWKNQFPENRSFWVVKNGLLAQCLFLYFFSRSRLSLNRNWIT